MGDDFLSIDLMETHVSSKAIDGGEELLKIRGYFKGVLVAEAEFLVNQKKKILKVLEVGVAKKFRRKGVATAIYLKAEALTGLQLRPGDDQSEEAEALWGADGRKFGL